jgi:hypothetical protein
MPKATSIRERIAKHCQLRRRTPKAETIVYGKREYRMNRFFENVTDAEVERIFNDKELGIGEFVKQSEAGKIAKAKKVSKVEVKPKPCECGCKAMAKPGSRFLPGHDAKLKSRLLKASRDGDKAAKKELVSRGWYKPKPKAKA